MSKMLRAAFNKQRHTAKWRGIEFLLSFEQWLRIWKESGHLNQHGRNRGQYVMARIGDRGAYEEGNVIIILCSENCSVPRPAEMRARISNTLTGYKRTPEEIKKSANARRGQKVSPETRARLSAAHIGRKLSPKHVANIAAAVKGHIKTDAHRLALSLAAKRDWEKRRASKAAGA